MKVALMHIVSLTAIARPGVLVIAFVFIAIFFGLPDHSLTVELLLAHLIEAILLIVAISDDACDLFSRDKLAIDLDEALPFNIVLIIDLFSVHVAAVGILAQMLLAVVVVLQLLKAILLVDLFSRGDGVLEINGNLVFAIFFIVVLIVAPMAMVDHPL